MRVVMSSARPDYVEVPFSELTDEQRHDAYERETFGWLDDYDYSQVTEDATYVANRWLGPDPDECGDESQWPLSVDSWDTNPLGVGISGTLTSDNAPALFSRESMRDIVEVTLSTEHHYRMPHTLISVTLTESKDDELYSHSRTYEDYLEKLARYESLVRVTLDGMFSEVIETVESSYNHLFSYERWSDMAEANEWTFDIYNG